MTSEMDTGCMFGALGIDIKVNGRMERWTVGGLGPLPVDVSTMESGKKELPTGMAFERSQMETGMKDITATVCGTVLAPILGCVATDMSGNGRMDECVEWVPKSWPVVMSTTENGRMIKLMGWESRHSPLEMCTQVCINTTVGRAMAYLNLQMGMSTMVTGSVEFNQDGASIGMLLQEICSRVVGKEAKDMDLDIFEYVPGVCTLRLGFMVSVSSVSKFSR
mmetsp:Transcript_3259/g.5505  ORF Transcript_3259/g.5505 Transcript_3259/m.5505 type:complete len:221 (+) Transcript_3259:305-967(+)